MRSRYRISRQRKPTARFAVTENRTRRLHARDIKDYNGRPLITGLSRLGRSTGTVAAR